MWKGVREAKCGWLEVEESWEGQRVSHVGPPHGAAEKAGSSRYGGGACPEAESPIRSVVGIYLAILAPLRGRVELWRMRHGPCVRTIPAPPGARLLTSRPVGRSATDGTSRRHDARGHSKLTSCYLLSGGESAGVPVTRLKLSPLCVEESDLALLPTR